MWRQWQWLFQTSETLNGLSLSAGGRVRRTRGEEGRKRKRKEEEEEEGEYNITEEGRDRVIYTEDSLTVWRRVTKIVNR